MYQLIPDHLIRGAQNGINVVNYIVCPNVIDIPLFMIHTDDFIKISDNSYKHYLLPLEVYIFNTMMPTKDEERNKKFMIQCENKQTEPLFKECKIKYYQNQDDHKFVDIFYNELKKSIENITSLGNYCSCFSFAVFNQNTQFRDISKFIMFKEILDCYTDPSRTIICEWMFCYDLYEVYNMKKTNINSICYVPPIKLKNITLFLHILVLTIDNLGNIVCEYVPVKHFIKLMKTTNIIPKKPLHLIESNP